MIAQTIIGHALHLLFAAAMIPLAVLLWGACWHLTETPALRHAFNLCDERACLRCSRKAKPWGI